MSFANLLLAIFFLSIISYRTYLRNYNEWFRVILIFEFFYVKNFQWYFFSYFFAKIKWKLLILFYPSVWLAIVFRLLYNILIHYIPHMIELTTSCWVGWMEFIKKFVYVHTRVWSVSLRECVSYQLCVSVCVDGGVKVVFWFNNKL